MDNQGRNSVERIGREVGLVVKNRARSFLEGCGLQNIKPMIDKIEVRPTNKGGYYIKIKYSPTGYIITAERVRAAIDQTLLRPE
jgi:hypothetical protein